jgi:replicative DNA helicase
MQQQIPSLDIVILHYALRNRKYMLELSKTAKASYFDPHYQTFYALLHSAFLDPNIKEVLSEAAFLEYCKGKNASSQAEGFSKIYKDALASKINESVIPDTDFSFYLQKFKERYNAVFAEDVMRDIAGALNEGKDIQEINKIFHDAVKEIGSIGRGKVFDEGTLGEDVVNMFKEYEEVQRAPESFKGVPSGFASIDSLTNGWFGGELIILAGMEGTGKSLLSMNFAVNAWLGSNRNAWFNPDVRVTQNILTDYTLDGHNVVYFTLEMPRSNKGKYSSAAYLNKRLISCISGLDFNAIRKGTLSPEEFERFKLVCKFIKKYDKDKKFYVVDIPRGATVEDIEAKYIEIKEKFDVSLVVIDYLGLMAGAEDEDDWEEIGRIAEQLHEFARVYDVPVISPVQLNRPTGAGQSLSKQNYNNTRIGRSAMIGQNANMVFQIACRDDEHNFVDMPLYITKMRDAPKGIIQLAKDFPRMRVHDSASQDETLDGISQFVDLGTEEEHDD